MPIKQHGGVFGRNPTFNRIETPNSIMSPSEDLAILADGNIAFKAAGQGLDFSATSGSGTSELFDDYEEGTWTPTLFGGGTQCSLSSADGSYVKVGNLVTLNFTVVCSSTNGGTGALLVKNLPFAIADVLPSTAAEASGAVGLWLGWATAINTPALYADQSGNQLQVVGIPAATATSISSLTALQLGTGQFRGTLSYRTA